MKQLLLPKKVRGRARIYSLAECTGIKKRTVEGRPDKALISASYDARQKLTMRMHMPHITRLTTSFSKKVENRMYAVGSHFIYYNFVKVHQVLRVTRSMAASLFDRIWNIADLAAFFDTKEEARKKTRALQETVIKVPYSQVHAAVDAKGRGRFGST